MKRKIFAAVLIFVFSLVAILFFSYISVRGSIDRPLDAGDNKTIAFEIKSGQGVREIATELEKARLISGKDFFQIYLWQQHLGSKLKAGAYELAPSMTIAQMVDIFSEGSSGLKSNEAQIVVVEGSSETEILEKLKAAQVVPDDANFDELGIDTGTYAFLADKPVTASLEGFLFPDTYNFFKNSSLDDVTVKMLDNFDKKFTPDLRSEIKKQGKSVYDIVTMASIVEKESPDKEDMSLIAGIFYNRLDINMALQSDATINYITNGGRPSPTSDDLETDSPYNTYKNRGLPPGPICNPGIEAIKAAIYPEKTDYFYFLMPQDGEGKTIFSKTYDEHLQNKAKYLK